MPGPENCYKTLFVHFIVCMLLFSGCAQKIAPGGWLAKPADMPTDGFGGWLQITSHAEVKYAGELIAVGKDSLYFANDTLLAFAISDIQSARLVSYKDNAEALGGFVALGTMSTLSHGFFLIFSAPIWMIAGGINAGSRSYEPIIDYPKQTLAEFPPYARFPQGLPAKIDRRKIKMKTIQ